jgi:hypothetical protein
MEIETMDPFIGYTDITQRANPLFHRHGRQLPPFYHSPYRTSPNSEINSSPPQPIKSTESLDSPSYGDKYTTICNILQAGATAFEMLDIPNPEDTLKDIISLIKFISHKLITIEHKQDTKTFEQCLDHLSQKIDHLTKTLLPLDQNYKIIVPQHCKPPSHTTHTTSKKQPNPQNPLA